MSRPRSSRYSRGFIPPSHVLKIVRDAEMSSNSSWSDSENESPRLILRDGKPGQRYFCYNQLFLCFFDYFIAVCAVGEV